MKSQKGKVGTIYDIFPAIDETGDWKVITDKDVIINSIKNLLLTPLGRYPFDPKLGSLLYKQIFELADQVTEEVILYEVTDRIEMYNDRVKVKNVKLSWNAQNKICGVDVYVKIKDDTMVTKISVFINYSTTTMFASVSETEEK